MWSRKRVHMGQEEVASYQLIYKRSISTINDRSKSHSFDNKQAFPKSTMNAVLATKTSLLTLGYLAVSTTFPFLLSYKETQGNSLYTKGYTSARSLINKI